MKGLARRGWWLGAAAVLLVLIGSVPLLFALLDAGYFRGVLIHYVEAHFNRSIRVEGPLHLQLWTRHPRIVAERLVIGNPSWVARGAQAPDEMGRIGRLTLVFSAPFGRGATLESVTLEDATLYLARDAQGHANWRRDASKNPPSKGIPLIKELSAEGVHVVLDDERRHLQFDGIASARGRRQSAPQRLEFTGKGELNGKPMSFEFSGDPLDSVRTDHPYAWEFTEESSASHVTVHGSLPQPFRVDLVDATFEASGEDLKDLYFLTGVTLVNTGAFKLTGNVERRGDDSRFTALHLHTGQSDVEGTLSITPVNERAQLDAKLSAKLVRTVDFGARAAGRAPPAEGSPHIFSDATFNPVSLRASDTQVHFTAQRVEVGRTALQSVSGQMKIDHGVVTVMPLTADLLQGKLEANVHLDANQDMPPVQASMRFQDLQLSALNHTEAAAPMEGLVQAHVDVKGKGRSIRQVVASANGTVSAALPQGLMRDSLAELAGVDLRGLGLKLAHSQRDTEIRCAAAVLKADDGVLTTRSLVIDTAPVLIKGEGEIHLDTEELDLTLRGEPKDLRLLRLDAPLLVRGTLARPSVTIGTRDSSVKLVDPGHAKDVDCAQLLAEAR
jgi:AsmA family protein